MIEHAGCKLSVRRQSELLGLNRSRIYYKGQTTDETDVLIVNEMMDINKLFPFYGYRRMHVELSNRGHEVNHKKIKRLMNVAGLKALYPKKRTTVSNLAHTKYPYLLRNLVIDRPNQVWSVDITYIKIRHGYIYLVCIIDIFSRKIMGWNLSPFLDTQSSIDALQFALLIGHPGIINSDQGCQYTSDEWITMLIENKIQISMDGKGRWADNIFIERFWRSLKYESLYLHSFETVVEAHKAFCEYINFYNQRRPHQALNYKTPDSVYNENKNIIQKEKFSYVNLIVEYRPAIGLAMGGV